MISSFSSSTSAQVTGTLDTTTDTWYTFTSLPHCRHNSLTKNRPVLSLWYSDCSHAKLSVVQAGDKPTASQKLRATQFFAVSERRWSIRTDLHVLIGTKAKLGVTNRHWKKTASQKFSHSDYALQMWPILSASVINNKWSPGFVDNCVKKLFNYIIRTHSTCFRHTKIQIHVYYWLIRSRHPKFRVFLFCCYSIQRRTCIDKL